MLTKTVYREDGQLLTASFMDIAMPRADDVLMIGFATEPVLLTTNQMGMKGCEKAETLGAVAAVSNAVQDGVWWKAGMPFTPLRVWDLLQDARVAAG